MAETRRENKKYRIGIVGLGSIGLTHINALKKLGVEQFFAFRTNKGAKQIDDDLNIISFNELNQFKEQDLDGIIISNPTALHIETLIKVKDLKVPVFIEKPISDNLIDLSRIFQIDEDLIKVGYCLRYHPVILRAKELIEANAIGSVFHARFQVGQYLPSWHPYTDYRKEYFSNKNLGGGALRTLSHELDLHVFFFGEPQNIHSYTQKISDLEIDVDDYSVIIAEGPNLVTRIELDFLTMDTYRNGVFYGDKGELHYDLITKKIKVLTRDNKKEIITDFVDSDMYVAQMNDFLNKIKNKETSLCSYEDAVTVMKIIEESETKLKK